MDSYFSGRILLKIFLFLYLLLGKILLDASEEEGIYLHLYETEIKIHQVNESDNNLHKCCKRAFGENRHFSSAF